MTNPKDLTPAERIEAGEYVVTGWDGRSRPIVDVRLPCGCRYTSTGRTKVRSCSEHLREAMIAAKMIAEEVAR
ncbi:MAG: hypothetical protein KGI89_15640 [Euryarchaeota archaeon]|nr:hypothetical protein [Euryarchaeota archaeon]